MEALNIWTMLALFLLFDVLFVIVVVSWMKSAEEELEKAKAQPQTQHHITSNVKQPLPWSPSLKQSLKKLKRRELK